MDDVTGQDAVAAGEPSWGWRLDFRMLKEAAEIRKRDPREFRGAVLTFFGFGGRDDGTIIRRMRAHPEGSRVLRERIPLPEGILEPERFADLPEGTLGYEYFRHCRDQRLDPKLISTESEKVAREIPVTDEHRFVYNRHRDSHDLWHVVLGYGTDMAGEAGIIAWTYGQTRNKAYGLICLLNAAMCTQRGRPDVFRTVWHGFRHGARSPLLLAVDWRRHLDRPLDAVRQELGLETARPYRVFHMADAPGAPDELPADA
jgi:ubiquinone biosynthesis protein COQ4